MGSPSKTVSCSRSVNNGISSFTSSSMINTVASDASCCAPLFWKKKKISNIYLYKIHMNTWHAYTLYINTTVVREYTIITFTIQTKYILQHYLHTNSQIVFFNRFVIQWMIHFYVRPSEAVVRSLLQVKRVEFVCLCCGSGHQAIKYRWVSFDARTEIIENIV